MSTFVPTKQNLREALLFCFNLKKSAADGHRSLCEAYGEHAPSIKTCEYWFRRFKSGDFDTSDKEREGRPVKFKKAELVGLLDENSCRTQEELAKTLSVTQQAISKRLKTMGMVQKEGNWQKGKGASRSLKLPAAKTETKSKTRKSPKTAKSPKAATPKSSKKAKIAADKTKKKMARKAAIAIKLKATKAAKEKPAHAKTKSRTAAKK